METLVCHGKEDIRYDTVSGPEIEDARSAIIEVTGCGSHLHLYHNHIALFPEPCCGPRRRRANMSKPCKSSGEALEDRA